MNHLRNSLFLVLVALVACSFAGCADDAGGDNGGTSSGADTSGATSGGDATNTTDDTSGSTTTTDTGTSGTSDATDTTVTPDLNDDRPQDADSDGILNDDEGAPDVDTDNDGTPDYLDPDSDDDGIPDLYEAGDFKPFTPPIDSDNDGTPDFRDTDSNGNGIPDAQDGRGDADGNGVPDYLETDADGDSFDDTTEIEGGGADCDGDGQADPPGTPISPRDCDQDGIPDYQEPDADADGIPDVLEGRTTDTDQDGFLDRYDDDSDNDGIPDRDEINPGSGIPRDTDADTIPDHRDPDSDGDGLADGAEITGGSNPYAADTDGDGVSDLIEVAAGTSATNSTDNPLNNGDFVFVLTYEQPPEPAQDTLAFRTNFQQADVYFLIDRTGSMLAEITAMRNAITGIITSLSCARSIAPCGTDADCAPSEACDRAENVCIEDPAQTGCIPSFWTGSAVFGGDPNLNSFANLQAINANGQATANALPNEVGNYGTGEALFAAVQCLVTPGQGGCDAAWTSNCVPGSPDCMGYRDDAARIFVTVSDEPNQWVNTAFTALSAGQTLIDRQITFIGIDASAGGAGNGIADLTALAQNSNSIDSNGQPFLRSGDGATIIGEVTEAIREVINEVPIDVTIEAAEVDGDAGEALRFLDYVEANLSGADLDANGVIDCESDGINPTDSADADDRPDQFPGLKPGRRICWDVHPITNTIEPAGDQVKLYELSLVVRGNGAILDQRSVFFLIPPKPPEIIN